MDMVMDTATVMAMDMDMELVTDKVITMKLKPNQRPFGRDSRKNR